MSDLPVPVPPAKPTTIADLIALIRRGPPYFSDIPDMLRGAPDARDACIAEALANLDARVAALEPCKVPPKAPHHWIDRRDGSHATSKTPDGEAVCAYCKAARP